MANQFVHRISATELARNLASVIDQVRVARQPMTITRGNQDIAQIVPVLKSSVQLSDLALVLNRHRVSLSPGLSFADDLAKIRQSAVLPDSSWDS